MKVSSCMIGWCFGLDDSMVLGLYGWLYGWKVGWIGEWMGGWMAERLAGRLYGWLDGCLVGWMAVWLAGWLSGWLGWSGISLYPLINHRLAAWRVLHFCVWLGYYDRVWGREEGRRSLANSLTSLQNSWALFVVASVSPTTQQVPLEWPRLTPQQQ